MYAYYLVQQNVEMEIYRSGYDVLNQLSYTQSKHYSVSFSFWLGEQLTN